MNNTVGEIEILGWKEYSLGAVVLVVFVAIAALNSLFLLSFYKLRNNAFVRNSKALISLIGTDLVNAVLLSPSLVTWFVVPPPHHYGMCVFKSAPFMLSNFTNLLHMASFCICRLIVIKKVANGRLKVANIWYGAASLCLWIISIAIIAIPYLFMGNFNSVINDCRRAVFSDVKLSLQYFAVVFDIPFVTMNVCLLILALWIRKNNLKVTHFVGPKQNTVVPSTIESKQKQNDYKVYCVSLNDKSHNSHISASNCSIYMAINNGHHGNHHDTGSPIFGDPESNTSEINARITALNGNKTSADPNPKTQTNNLLSALDDDAREKQRNECIHSPVRTHEYLSNSTSDHDIAVKEENHHLVKEVKQFLITLGILILLYDVTILPLLIDINAGAINPTVTMPHVLNSLCFLNSLFNPVVYLIRMKTTRREMKLLVHNCLRCAN